MVVTGPKCVACRAHDCLGPLNGPVEHQLEKGLQGLCSFCIKTSVIDVRRSLQLFNA